MTLEQRKEYPTLMFVTPPTRKTPSAAQLKDWEDAKMYGVWIDNKRVSNEVLSNYKPEDFALCSSSRLAKNAMNYGKHYVQVNLLTNEKYAEQYKDNEEMLIVLGKATFRKKPATK